MRLDGHLRSYMLQDNQVDLGGDTDPKIHGVPHIWYRPFRDLAEHWNESLRTGEGRYERLDCGRHQ